MRMILKMAGLDLVEVEVDAILTTLLSMDWCSMYIPATLRALWLKGDMYLPKPGTPEYVQIVLTRTESERKASEEIS